MEPDKVDVVAEHADILQVGARNVQNFPLLRRVGDAGKPVLLKRGMATTIQEWLLSAEYVLARGNPNVILCERGIRTFEASTRFTLDLNAVPAVKTALASACPGRSEPRNGPLAVRRSRWPWPGSRPAPTGSSSRCIRDPEEALSDGPQSLKPERFAALMQRVRKIARAMDRDL